MEGLYTSITDFVDTNNLKNQAQEVFGKEWEPEEDVQMAKELCEHIDQGKYIIVPNDNTGAMNSDFEFEVVSREV